MISGHHTLWGHQVTYRPRSLFLRFGADGGSNSELERGPVAIKGGRMNHHQPPCFQFDQPSAPNLNNKLLGAVAHPRVCLVVFGYLRTD